MPEVGRFDLRWTRTSLDHLSRQHNLKILARPASWRKRFQLLDLLRVGDKLSGYLGAMSPKSSDNYDNLLSIGVDQSGDNRVVFR